MNTSSNDKQHREQDLLEQCLEEMDVYSAVIGIQGLLTALIKLARSRDDTLLEALIKSAKMAYVELSEDQFVDM